MIWNSDAQMLFRGMIELIMTTLNTMYNEASTFKNFDNLLWLYRRQLHAVTSIRKAVLTSLSGIGSPKSCSI